MLACLFSQINLPTARSLSNAFSTSPADMHCLGLSSVSLIRQAYTASLPQPYVETSLVPTLAPGSPKPCHTLQFEVLPYP